MNPLSIILFEIIKRPIFNLLIVLIYIFAGNIGLAIIILTIVVRFALLKTSLAQGDMQKQMTDLQPKMKEIQEKHKDNPEKQSEEFMKLMKTKGAGPLKGCLMTLVQLPVFLGLFWVIRDFSTGIDNVSYNVLYSFFHFFGNTFFYLNGGDTFVFNIDSINQYFLGMDLFKSGYLALAILCAIFMYLQMKMTMMNSSQQASKKLPDGTQLPDMGKMMGFMNIFLVMMMGTFVYKMPAGIGLYIVSSTLFGLVQYSIQYRKVLSAKFQALTNKK